MNPSWWIPLGILSVIAYLFYLLTIEFRLARLDDAVAPPDLDVHNDLQTWSYEYYFPRVKARKFRAFLRWVGVSSVIMVICVLFSGGGSRAVKALALATPTPTPTLTSTPSPTPLATATPTLTSTPQATFTPWASPTQRIFTPGPASVIQVTRIVQVTKLVQITKLVPVIQTQLVMVTPGATQTPWIIYQPVTVTPTGSPSETPTLTETATTLPSETPTPTPTETQQVNP